MVNLTPVTIWNKDATGVFGLDSVYVQKITEGCFAVVQVIYGDSYPDYYDSEEEALETAAKWIELDLEEFNSSPEEETLID